MHGPAIFIYSFLLVLEKWSLLELYSYWHQTFGGGVSHDVSHIKLDHSYICILILEPLRRLVPLSLVMLKRPDDIFMAFSKIDNPNQVCLFQVVYKIKADEMQT